MHINKIDYSKIFLLVLIILSYFLGFLLRENSAGGGLIDLSHEWHNYLLLKQDILGFLYGNYEASRFPLFHRSALPASLLPSLVPL